jgi:hypothetical protein
MNQLEEREKLRAAGVTGEVAFWILCQPAPDELVVVWCDRIARTLRASPDMGDSDATGSVMGSWDEFEPRYCGPFDTASRVHVGDFVTYKAKGVDKH